MNQEKNRTKNCQFLMDKTFFILAIKDVKNVDAEQFKNSLK